MANPFAQIDRLVARFKLDLGRVKDAVRSARGTSVKVLPTGIWKCRFRPYGADAPVDVRGASAEHLLSELRVLVEKSSAARSAAKAQRAERRRVHLDEVARVKVEAKKLGATRIKARRTEEGYCWTCFYRERSTGEVKLLEAFSSGELLDLVQSVVPKSGR